MAEQQRQPEGGFLSRAAIRVEQEMERGMHKVTETLEKTTLSVARGLESGTKKVATKMIGEERREAEFRTLFKLSEDEHILAEHSCRAVASSIYEGRLTMTEQYACFISPTKTVPIVATIALRDVESLASGHVVYTKGNRSAATVVEGPPPTLSPGELATRAILLFTKDKKIHTFTDLPDFLVAFHLVSYLWRVAKLNVGVPVPVVEAVPEPVAPKVVARTVSPPKKEVAPKKEEPPKKEEAPAPSKNEEAPTAVEEPTPESPSEEVKTADVQMEELTAGHWQAKPAGEAQSQPLSDVEVLQQEMAGGPVQPKS